MKLLAEINDELLEDYVKNSVWIDLEAGQREYKDFVKSNFSNSAKKTIAIARQKEIVSRKVAIRNNLSSAAVKLIGDQQIPLTMPLWIQAFVTGCLAIRLELIALLCLSIVIGICMVYKLVMSDEFEYCFDYYYNLWSADIESKVIEKVDQEEFFAYHILKMVEKLQENNTELLDGASLKEIKEKCHKILGAPDSKEFLICEAKLAVKEITALSDRGIELYYRYYRDSDSKVLSALKNVEKAKICSREILKIFQPAWEVIKKLDPEFGRKFIRLWKKANIREQGAMKAISLCTEASLDTVPLNPFQRLPRELQEEIFDYTI